MAPPKFDLNNKEKQAAWDEKVPTSQAYVVDQPMQFCKTAAQGQCTRRRRTCKAAGCILISLIVIVAIAVPVMIYLRKHHRDNFNRWCATDDLKRPVPEHVRIDFNRQLIYVNNTKSGDFGVSHALHDYNKKISVFRDPVHKKCYLEPLNNTFEEGVNAWDRDYDEGHEKDSDDHDGDSHDGDSHEDDSHEHKDHERKGRHHYMKPKRLFKTGKPTEKDTARHMWGDAVADHCHGHTFHMLTPIRGPPPPLEEKHFIVRIVSVDAIRIIYIRIIHVAE